MTVMRFVGGRGILLFASSIHIAQPPIQYIPGIKWHKQEAIRAPLASITVTYTYMYTYTSAFQSIHMCAYSSTEYKTCQEHNHRQNHKHMGLLHIQIYQ
jgi:hypothetical protein